MGAGVVATVAIPINAFFSGALPSTVSGWQRPPREASNARFRCGLSPTFDYRRVLLTNQRAGLPDAAEAAITMPTTNSSYRLNAPVGRLPHRALHLLNNVVHPDPGQTFPHRRFGNRNGHCH